MPVVIVGDLNIRPTVRIEQTSYNSRWLLMFGDPCASAPNQCTPSTPSGMNTRCCLRYYVVYNAKRDNDPAWGTSSVVAQLSLRVPSLSVLQPRGGGLLHTVCFPVHQLKRTGRQLPVECVPCVGSLSVATQSQTEPRLGPNLARAGIISLVQYGQFLCVGYLLPSRSTAHCLFMPTLTIWHSCLKRAAIYTADGPAGLTK